jgi:alkylated DNA repair dioxygenase AlkB
VKQQSLFPHAQARTGPVIPEGLRYFPDFISETEEQALTTTLTALPLKPFEFHGYVGNRRVLSFGLRYDYSRQSVERAAEPPSFLYALRERIAKFAGRSSEEFCQIGINEYRPGAGIGWHKDKTEFGDVVGVSLLSAVTMRLRKRSGNSWLRTFQVLEPRSIYILTGEIRHEWEHSIAPVSFLRYSLTFRTLAAGASRS